MTKCGSLLPSRLFDLDDDEEDVEEDDDDDIEADAVDDDDGLPASSFHRPGPASFRRPGLMTLAEWLDRLSVPVNGGR